MATFELADVARRDLAEHLRDTPGFAGVGVIVRNKGYGIKVNLAAAAKDSSAVPAKWLGVPVETEVIGPVKAY
jgi:hypothetical protein